MYKPNDLISQKGKPEANQSLMPSSTSSSSSSSNSLRRRACCSSLFFFCHILNKNTQKPKTAATPSNTMTAFSATDPLEEEEEALFPFLGLGGSFAKPESKRVAMEKRRNWNWRDLWRLWNPFMSWNKIVLLFFFSLSFLGKPNKPVKWTEVSTLNVEFSTRYLSLYAFPTTNSKTPNSKLANAGGDLTNRISQLTFLPFRRRILLTIGAGVTITTLFRMIWFTCYMNLKN